jgi:hypothetical protein
VSDSSRRTRGLKAKKIAALALLFIGFTIQVPGLIVQMSFGVLNGLTLLRNLEG